MNDELPCLGLLEATPAILRGLMSCHLSHSESHCYRHRLDRFLAEPVRARKYLTGAGPLGAEYRLKP